LGIVMVTSTASAALADPPGSRTSEAAVDVPSTAPQVVRDLASDPKIAEALSKTTSRANVTTVLSAVDNANISAIAERTVPLKLGPYIDPGWGGSGEEVTRLLLENFDDEKGHFDFDTEHPVADRVTARLVLQGIALHVLKDPANQKATEILSQLLRTGQVPDGVELERTTRGPPSSETTPDDVQVPTPQRTQPAPAEVVDENVVRSVVDDCEHCGAIVNLTQPISTSVDLGEVNDRSLQQANLRVHAFDVDRPTGQPCGAPVERDSVHLNGDQVGVLEGENDAWSTTEITLPISLIEDGVNTIQILPDTEGSACWETKIAWISLEVRSGQVPADEPIDDDPSVPDTELDPDERGAPAGTNTEGGDVRGAFTPASTSDGSELTFFLNDCPKCDQYLYGGEGPITASFTLDEIKPEEIQEATVDVRTYDVDWSNTGDCQPERDLLNVNGNPVDYVTGANSRWSDTSFNLNPDWFQKGENTLSIDIDVLGTGCWAVEVDYFDLRINGATGPLTITDQETDRDGYNLGDTIQATTTVKNEGEETETANFEWNLVRPDGEIPETVTGPTALLEPDESAQRTEGIPVPSSGEQGTWTVVGIARTSDGEVSDREATEVEVGSDFAITDDDLDGEVLSSNENSDAATVELTGTFDYVSTFTESKTIDIQYELVEGGPTDAGGIVAPGNTPTTVDEKTKTIDIPPSDEGTLILPSVEFDVEMNSDQRLTVALDDASDVQETDETNNLASVDEFGTPSVENVKPRFEGDFLAGKDVPLTQTYTAKVEDPELGEPVDRVKFELVDGSTDNVVTSEVVENPSQPNHYSWDKEIWELLDEGDYRVEATAITEDDVASQPYRLYFDMFEPPRLADILLTLQSGIGDSDEVLTSQPSGDQVKYFAKTEWGVGFAIEDSVITNSATLSAARDLVEKVGFCLTEELGWGIAAETEHTALSKKSEWSSSAKIKGNLTLLGATGEIAGGASGTWTLLSSEWELDKYGLQFEAKVIFTCHILDALLSVLRAAPVPGTAALAEGLDWMKDNVNLRVVFQTGPKYTADLTFEPGTPEIFGLPVTKWTNFFGAEHKLTANASASIAKFGAEFAGNTGFSYTINNPGDNRFDRLGFCVGGCKAEAWAQASLGPWEAKHTFFSGSVFDNGELVWSEDDITSFLSHTESPADASFQTGEVTTNLVDEVPSVQPVEGSQATIAIGLPDGRNAVAITDSAHDELRVLHDTNNPDQDPGGVADVGQIRMMSDGSTAASTVVDSPRVDATPEATVAEDGSRVLAFQRITDRLTPGDNPFPHLDSTRVMVATAEPGEDYTNPVQVTEDGGYQQTPRVAVGDTGEHAGVAWVEDTDPEWGLDSSNWVLKFAPIVDGTPGEPIELDAGASYPGAPGVAVLPGGTALVAYTVADDDRSVEMRAIDLETGETSDPVTIEDADDPSLPRVVADETGVTVAWIEDVGSERLVERTVPYNPTTGDLAPTELALAEKAVIVPAHAGETFTRIEADSDDTGQRVFAWHNFAEDAVRTATYEPKPNELPRTGLVATNAETAHHLDPVREPETVVEENVSRFDATFVESRDTLAVAATQPGEDGGRLAVHETPIGPDLRLQDLSADPANPAPGESANVTATVTNAGERLAPANQVLFTAENTVIGAQAVEPLAPGQTVKVEIPWNVPNATRSNELAAYIDSHDATTDPNKGNAIEHTVTLPNLEIVTTGAQEGEAKATLTATVENDGVIPSEDGIARFVDDEGTTVDAAPLDALDPGAATVSEATITVPGIDPGTDLTAIAEAGPDFDAEDNEQPLPLDLGPNLAIENLEAEVSGDDEVTIAATVTNDGAITSTPVRVEGVDADETRLFETTAPALGPGETERVSVAFPAPTGRTEIRVTVDADRELSEPSTVDNTDRVVVEPTRQPRPEVDAASLQYTDGGVRVQVHNEGGGKLGMGPFALYEGPPKDKDPYGRLYETRVTNLFTESAISLVEPLSTGHTDIPTSELVSHEGTSIADLPADGQVSLRLEPDRVPIEDATEDMIVEQPLVSVNSPTHPNPGEARYGSTGTFELAVAPGHTTSGYSYAVTTTATTTPDQTEDTTSSTLELSGLDPGNRYLHVRANLTSGWTDTLHYPIDVAGSDDEPPTTTLETGTPGVEPTEGTHVISSSTWIQLDAADPNSGVDETLYTVDAGPEQAYHGRFTLPIGEHTVTFHSVDQAGNVEDTDTATIRVEPSADPTAPDTSIRTEPATLDTDRGPVVAPGADVLLEAEDPYERTSVAPSGVDQTTYSVDEGGETVYEGPFAAPTNGGEHTIAYESVDRTGNTEATETFDFQVDATPPEVEIASPDDDAIVAREMTVTVRADDSLAGVDEVELFHDGRSLGFADETEPGVYERTVDVSTWPMGNNNVTALGHDRTGNTASDTTSVYVLSRSVQIPSEPRDTVPQLVYGPVYEEVDE